MAGSFSREGASGDPRGIPSNCHQSTSLVILNIDDYGGLPASLCGEAITALSRNTFLKNIRITVCSGLRNSLDITMSSPNLKALIVHTISE